MHKLMIWVWFKHPKDWNLSHLIAAGDCGHPWACANTYFKCVNQNQPVFHSSAKLSLQWKNGCHSSGSPLWPSDWFGRLAAHNLLKFYCTWAGAESFPHQSSKQTHFKRWLEWSLPYLTSPSLTRQANTHTSSVNFSEAFPTSPVPPSPVKQTGTFQASTQVRPSLPDQSRKRALQASTWVRPSLPVISGSLL